MIGETRHTPLPELQCAHADPLLRVSPGHSKLRRRDRVRRNEIDLDRSVLNQACRDRRTLFSENNITFKGPFGNLLTVYDDLNRLVAMVRSNNA